jgi:hypothetical protein
MLHFYTNEEYPFEIHITVKDGNIEHFKTTCETLYIKPLLIDLQVDNACDLMTSSIGMFWNNNQLQKELDRITSGLTTEGFEVIRSKVECSPNHPIVPRTMISGAFNGLSTPPSHCYFEAHLSLNLDEFSDVEELNSLCSQNNAHLSRNKFKKIEDSYTQMITIREYKGTLDKFMFKCNDFINLLMDNHFEVIRSIVEYCIHDDKISHDNKWMKELESEIL